MKKFLFAFLIVFLSVGKLLAYEPIDGGGGGEILDCGPCPGGGSLSPIMDGCTSGYVDSICDFEGSEYLTCGPGGCMAGYTRTLDDSWICPVYTCEGVPLCFGTHTTENVAFTDAYGSGYTVTFKYTGSCSCGGIQ